MQNLLTTRLYCALCIALTFFTFTHLAQAHSYASPYLSGPDEWFGSEEGRRITANILSYQSDAGSWPKNIDTTSSAYTGDRARLSGTFDNDATTDELRFLARAYRATNDGKDHDALLKGFDHILKAQYPTGGWPQFYPPDKQYHRRITFNDDAMVRVMQFLRETYTSSLFSFLDQPRRDAARAAFDRGIDCILKCQIRADGKLAAWCAQHDEIDYSPRVGRSYELVSISGGESVEIVRLLMSLDPPNPQVVQSIQGAIAWFEAAKLSDIRLTTLAAPGTPKGTDRVVVQDIGAPPMWARFYEIGTNRPIFSDRDGIARHTLAEIGYERRNGYSWLNYWPQKLLATEYPAWQKKWAALLAMAPGAPKISAPAGKQESATGISHSFLALGAETYIVDENSSVTWSYPANTRDGWVLPGGNLLLALSKTKELPGGAAAEITREGKVVWQYKGTQSEVNTAQLLNDGRILITEAGPKPRIVELDRRFTIDADVAIQAQIKDLHLQTRMTRKLPGGNYLVPQLLDKVVREYTPAGKIAWEAHTPEAPPECWPFTAIRLDNGNTLVTCTHGKTVIEFDPAGRIAWQLSNSDLAEPLLIDPCGAQRLANGNTVITSYGSNQPGAVKMLEVTPQKQLVWTYRDQKNHGIHEFQILSTNGKAETSLMK